MLFLKDIKSRHVVLPGNYNYQGDIKRKTHPQSGSRMGKNCYEKEKINTS